jgi:signal transduction histidine kinase
MDNILVIDDEKATLAMLGLLLRAYGYRVLTAENAPAGLEIFEKEKPLVVLTDIKMPGMDGIQLLRKIKALNQDAEVIMITGHGDIELAIQSMKFDATDFITKPINSDVLEIALKRVNERISMKAAIRNYTENLEKLVEEKSRKLVEAERLAAVGQTVAGLAHAIKNVTSGLSGGAYVVETGIQLDDPAYRSQGWEMIKRNIGRIEKMVLDLLSYAKERRPAYRVCDPNSPAREVFDLMRSRAEENGIAFVCDLAEDIPDALFDPEGIHRCLLNLVANAIEAFSDSNPPDKKGKILIRSLKPEGWAVQYEVVDNGVGMDEETKSKVFKLFFSTKGSKGTGLGLMMTKKTIDEHKGSIEVSSEHNKGTRFTVRLPEINRAAARCEERLQKQDQEG